MWQIGYSSQKEAASAISAIKETSHRSNIPRRYYYCKECGQYVLTSQKKSNKHADRKRKL